ncbi:glycosyltransferase family 2 protein [Vampirovibrio sp.]|uniref:glycosyltransferase family 2 protein n=1 Tax=Vampirovibrio sp. TaxID=2717857 RepID=UPI003593B928
MNKPSRKISLLIPVYNEVDSLEILLGRVESVDFCGLEKELVIVDDGSEDGTRDILRSLETSNPEYRIIYHAQNMGKGAALRTAIDVASGDIVAIQDADLEYDPRDYPPLIRMIVDNQADVVYGSRLSNGKSNEAFAGLHYLGNKFLTLVTNVLYQTRITDMETCYKVFRADIIKSIKIRSNRFDFEPEITAKILKKKWRIAEAPISYQGRAFHEGKKITWVDGLWALKALVKFRFID